MSFEVFTQRWAQAWADELRSSPDYRRAALKWEGSIVVEMLADPEAGVEADRAVFLDLHRGDCRGAWIAGDADLDNADYVIRAPAGKWRRVLEGELDPLLGLMTGKLTLARGSLARLTPHVNASKELVAAAARLESHYPNQAPIANQAHIANQTPIASALTVQPAAKERPGEMPEETDAARSTASTVLPFPAERVLRSTSRHGLDYSLPPMRLWKKAKRFGVWDPFAIDFELDRRDWRRLDDLEHEVLLHLSSLFLGGEESVTLDLLPLIAVIAEEGRLEEEMYLTSFLWEEAKHVEVFRRFLDEVAEDESDLSRFHGEHYRSIFYRALPAALGRLRHESTALAQAEASVTYNMIVEGVLAETGYHGYHAILARNGLMPGMQQAVAHLKSDESRHLAYGVFLLSRLVAEHGEGVWERIEERMGELLPVAISVIEEIFTTYESMPFGLRLEEFTDFAHRQFQNRFTRIERARHQSLDEISRLPTGEEYEGAAAQGDSR